MAVHHGAGPKARRGPDSLSTSLTLRFVQSPHSVVRGSGGDHWWTAMSMCGCKAQGYPGRKGRGATDADIEVPAQLLRDLFDGVTHMDALEIDADAL